MFLSVQTLKFEGDTKEQKLPRTCFKYKALDHGNNHRMFIKEAIENYHNLEEACPSQQNSYHLDDYVKYIMSPDVSRPSTGKARLHIREDLRYSRDKAVQVEVKLSNLKDKQLRKPKPKIKKSVKLEEKIVPRDLNKKEIDGTMGEEKIFYHKSSKRKSITISRAQSPETVQVIRVDVVCNYSHSGSTISEHDKKNKSPEIVDVLDNSTKGNKTTNSKHKYLLTKTVKSLDEKVSGGANVTLLCKTYRLADRVRGSNQDRKQTTTFNYQDKSCKKKTFGSLRSKAT